MKEKIVIYKTLHNDIELHVQFEKETVWLKQDQIAKLFGKERSVITRQY